MIRWCLEITGRREGTKILLQNDPSRLRVFLFNSLTYCRLGALEAVPQHALDRQGSPPHTRRVTARLGLELRPHGLYMPALDLYLDPTGDVPRAFVSHAHVRSCRAETTYASRETLTLLSARTDEGESRTRLPNKDGLLIEWGGAVELPLAKGDGTARLSVAPAGHMLGAAQLVVDHPGGRFVYTGDYRTGDGRTHMEGAAVLCDELAIESTFALPIFRFPERETQMRNLLDWCARHLSEGRRVVLLTQAAGMAQELVHRLLDARVAVVAHAEVRRVCEAYESLGVPLGVSDGRLGELLDDDGKAASAPGFVIVASPKARGALRKLRGAKVALVSGTAVLDAAIEQRRADAGFVMSDHADYDDLMTTVRKSSAKHVHVTHGDTTAFASLLRRAGISATALESGPLDDEDAA
jgi:putative mRNA 3-end processing factor